MMRRVLPLLRRLGAAPRTLACRLGEGGNAAIEFALLAPVFLLVLAATFELASVIHLRFELNAQVSAAANHSLAVGGAADDNSAPGQASMLAALLADGPRVERASVSVNQAAVATFDGAAVSAVRTGRRVAECYCPMRVGDRIVWGGATACGGTCGDGSRPGRFVLLEASADYVPLLGGVLQLVRGIGLADGETIAVQAIARMP